MHIQLNRDPFYAVKQLFIRAVTVFTLTRLAILIGFGKNIEGSFIEILRSFCVGFIYDITIAAAVTVPLLLQIGLRNNFIYTPKGRYWAIGTYLIIIFLFLFTNLLPKDFSEPLYKGLSIYICTRFVIYLFLLFRTPDFRTQWRRLVDGISLTIATFVLLFNAVSEFLFWNEFASRYNFIAVDYLIYTYEVAGNIRESYPLTSIVVVLIIISLALLFPSWKKISTAITTTFSFPKKVAVVVLVVVLSAGLLQLIQPNWKNTSKNNYLNELAGNGVYEFAQAFKKNELDFYTYYHTIADSIAYQLVRKQLSNSYSSFISTDPYNLIRQVHYTEPEKKMNVVLISVESLSASFMKAFGNNQQLTPQLDALAEKGMLFTNLYATGTRTVRGLEALSLSIPPLPGQSIVKRPDNEQLFTLGSILKSKGYATNYIYGGYGYFDNMSYFFSNNDYTVTDRSALSPTEIHYANIWGVADEDLFTLTLRKLDEDYKSGKLFFSHIMTVSNHRPFTYPENRIDIPPSSQTREGAVKYTDYAIGDFIKRASEKPWYHNTIFVIVADHCASSAGKHAISLPGYHIPLLIFTPNDEVQPQQNPALMSQLDIPPTILGLMNMSYETKFFGQDIMRTPPEKQIAYLSTYQGLGYLTNNNFIVQSPVKQVKGYTVEANFSDIKEASLPDSIETNAVAVYQVAASLIKHKKYGAIKKN